MLMAAAEPDGYMLRVPDHPEYPGCNIQQIWMYSSLGVDPSLSGTVNHLWAAPLISVIVSHSSKGAEIQFDLSCLLSQPL